eukprot:CAMPEP_0167765936 /NCGR_PEP_ID=MMETSP0110_2-20121227/15013_1 /TAXON_ID=629695 /ORGANISM="Gymnochlora sp., Strain CCMP2014" /LENGTH=65 /DNA_ID=CAMNT_0007653803 /DNA_START=245 /DNA_END=439 /DNA_ORIENTATION=-
MDYLDLDGDGRIQLKALKTPEAAEILLKYRFPRNRKRTEHVVYATLQECLEGKIIDVIVSYTSDW